MCFRSLRPIKAHYLFLVHSIAYKIKHPGKLPKITDFFVKELTSKYGIYTLHEVWIHQPTEGEDHLPYPLSRTLGLKRQYICPKFGSEKWKSMFFFDQK